MGLPYVLSSDLVSAYPAKSLEIAQYVDGLIPLLAMTQNAQTGTTYSFLLTDFTKLVTLSNASAVAVTLPLESSVAWPAGTQLRLLNLGAGTVTVAGAVGVTISGTPLTLAQFKGANLIKTGTNTWVMLPFASGVGAADFSDTATGTYSGYKYLLFNSSGTITISTAGFADILVVGGGAGGGTGAAIPGAGGGGAGGHLVVSNAYLPVGTLTVTVGAGGSASATDTGRSGQNGNTSRLDSFYSPGGGGGGGWYFLGSAAAGGGGNGASGGGGLRNLQAGGSGISAIGFDGGAGAVDAGGGGGGGGALGVNGTSGNGGAGGAGVSNSYTGSAVTRAGGGGGGGNSSGGGGGSGGGGAGSTGSATAGTANTGGGGGAGTAGGAGGSGLVIVRVAV